MQFPIYCVLRNTEKERNRKQAKKAYSPIKNKKYQQQQPKIKYQNRKKQKKTTLKNTKYVSTTTAVANATSQNTSEKQKKKIIEVCSKIVHSAYIQTAKPILTIRMQ